MKGKKLRRRIFTKLLVLVSGIFLFCSAFAVGKAMAYRNIESMKLTANKTQKESTSKAADKTKKVEDTAKETTAEENKNSKDSESKTNIQTVQPAQQQALQNPSATAKPDGSKVAYLTFDDGPSYNVTPRVLDLLKKYNIKATFFVVGTMAQRNPKLLMREKNEGHVIANHSYTHIYKNLYSSPSNFLNELAECNKVVDSIIGSHDGKLVRFPGGSYGRQEYRNAAIKAGYHYVDWDCLTGDQDGHVYTKDQLIDNFKKTAGNKKQLVVLMHDIPSRSPNMEEYEPVIQYLKANGYVFKTLQ